MKKILILFAHPAYHKSRINKALINAIQNIEGVITSYSIHYTKLYDPAYHKSRINKALINAIQNIDGVTVNNLYEKYPDFFIDVPAEQRLLLENDIIIWHHPFYCRITSYNVCYTKLLRNVEENKFCLQGKVLRSQISSGNNQPSVVEPATVHAE